MYIRKITVILRCPTCFTIAFSHSHTITTSRQCQSCHRPYALFWEVAAAFDDHTGECNLTLERDIAPKLLQAGHRYAHPLTTTCSMNYNEKSRDRMLLTKKAWQCIEECIEMYLWSTDNGRGKGYHYDSAVNKFQDTVKQLHEITTSTTVNSNSNRIVSREDELETMRRAMMLAIDSTSIVHIYDNNSGSNVISNTDSNSSHTGSKSQWIVINKEIDYDDAAFEDARRKGIIPDSRPSIADIRAANTTTTTGSTVVPMDPWIEPCNPVETALNAIITGKLSIGNTTTNSIIDPSKALALYLHHFDYSRVMKLHVVCSPFAPIIGQSSIYFDIRSSADHRSIDIQDINYDNPRWVNYGRHTTSRPTKLDFNVLSIEEVEGEQTIQYGYDLLKMLRK